MFLIRTAFWLTLVICLFPTDKGTQDQLLGTAAATWKSAAWDFSAKLAQPFGVEGDDVNHQNTPGQVGKINGQQNAQMHAD